MPELKAHPLADLFPLMSETEFAGLRDSIKQNGLLEPIVIHEDMILDGRNRYAACREVGVSPSTRQYDGDNALQYVVDKNLNRRHLDESQRNMVGARLANMQHGGDRKSEEFQGPNLDFEISATDAAKMLNTSRSGIFSAKQVLKKGSQDLIDKVDQGEIPVSRAAKIAALPQEKQEKAISHEMLKKKNEESKDLTSVYTADDEWNTPADIIESARLVMGSIDLDPASNDDAQKVVMAKQYFTAQDDGLSKEWFGNVWMNPPYSTKLVDAFTKKLVSEVESMKVWQAIMITNNSTDTAWFHHALNACSLCCFTRGRVKFLKADGAKNSPTNGQVIMYFGDRWGRFLKEFSRYGAILSKFDESF